MSEKSMDDANSATLQGDEDGAVLAATTDPAAEPSSEAPIPEPKPDYSIFTTWQKRWIVLGAAATAFFSPLSAQIYLPALTLLSTDFNITAAQANLTVTTYMILQGITPMFIGSLADAAGRRPAHVICFVVYIAANIGCALAPNYPALLVLRMLQSAGSSSTVALCQAVVSDVVTSAERGQYVGFVSVPIILAPALGPVIGGLLSQFLGWRWIFWFLAILAGIVFVIYVLIMPETCRNIVGDGSIRPHPYYRTLLQLGQDSLRKWKAKRGADDLALKQTTSRVSKHSFRVQRPNPFRSLVILFEIEMFLLLMYSSLVFAGFYAIATAMPSLLSDAYGFDELKVGLMYLPLAGGSVAAAFIVGKMTTWNYRRHCVKLGIPFERTKQQDLSDYPIEKARLQVGLPLLVLSTAVLCTWGFALQYNAPVAVPCILLFLMGVGMVGFSNTTSTLVVDIYPGNAGAATASNNLTRCLVGAAASAVIDPMINGVGAGWAFFIIGAINAVAAPVLFLIMKNGIKWRKAKLERSRLRKERKAANNAATDAAVGPEDQQGAEAAPEEK
ncbi:major facilitator superfamily domain-containing protein [Xylariales sp. PMI_506]|nr:major facilitator superfamily domain-containing protein [Xylariales sp. PMI_506]